MIRKVIETPLGEVALIWEDGILAGVDLEPGEAKDAGDRPHPGALPKGEADLERAARDFHRIAEQLDAYFQNGARGFHLKLDLKGTAFQRRVWKALRRIPPGQTMTYGELAKRLGTGARAVGGACRANPYPIVIPCHRVVAMNGLGGFSGDTCGRKLQVKRWLLRHEGVRFAENI